MFKKLFFALFVSLVLMVSVPPVFAANVHNSEIMDTDYNAVTTTDTSNEMAVAGYEKIAFFVTYDETEVGNSISAAVTCQVSYDGDTWLSASFYDYAGGSTLQTSETISADGSYYFWFNKDLCVPYVRLTVAATNTDADDLLTVKAYLVAKE